VSADIARQPTERPALDRRFESISWALFLIMIGGIGLIQNVPQGAWLIATGAIMIGLNVARVLNGIHVSAFTLGLGVLALLLGLGGITGIDLPFFPLLLIIIGADILFKVATRSGRGANHAGDTQVGADEPR
jgi:hypothetical protein